jgi:2-polyprenyl-3-methyl-5-hydroxy-6-metoxy-1,4-benzoquinol methylase
MPDPMVCKAIDLFAGEAQNYFDHTLYHLARYKCALRMARSADHYLDVGCGAGYGTRLVAGYVKSAVGIDSDPDLLGRAADTYHRENLTYVQTDAVGYVESGGTRGGPMSLITCFEMIEHVDREVAVRLLRGLRDHVMGPGSLLVLSTPRWLPFERRSPNRQKEHRWEYTYDDLQDLLGAVFARPLILTQTDETIGAGNPDACWTYIAMATT